MAQVLTHNQTFDTPQKALLHFGVLGMRWGFRKEAQRNFDQIALEVNSRQETARLNSAISENKFAAFDDRDVVILKGSELRRVTQHPEIDSASDQLYVSTNAQDATNYRALYSYDKRVVNYETVYQTTQDLISPSEKTRVEAYVKLMGTSDIPMQDGRVLNGREYLREAGLGSVVDGLSNRQLALTYYGQLVMFQGIKNEPIGSAYFRELQRLGYNALVDDNDRNILSSQPLLTFGAKQTLVKIRQERITAEAQVQARKNMRIPDRI